MPNHSGFFNKLPSGIGHGKQRKHSASGKFVEVL